jgi:hypothetical protein
MTVHRIECYAAECDLCGTRLIDDASGTNQFTSWIDARAVAAAHGWCSTEGGALTCHRCKGVAAAIACPHDWVLVDSLAGAELWRCQAGCKGFERRRSSPRGPTAKPIEVVPATPAPV